MSDKTRCREVSYDILRCISCISVVILHVAAMYVSEDYQSFVDLNEFMTASIWRVITRLAVPSFVMLSGAFLIIPQNEDFQYFYRKMLRKIIHPTIIFSFIYVGYHYMKIIGRNILNISLGKDDDLWLPILNLLRGIPHDMMWYMFMIIGLYFITPVIVMIKGKISLKSYQIWACIMLIYGMLVNYTCSLSWILQFVPWIGYFLMGNVIKEYIKAKRENTSGGKMSAIAIAIAYLSLIMYWYLLTYKSGTVIAPESFSPIVVLSTLLQFAGISFLDIKKNHYLISTISKYSLQIYLIHPIFVEVFILLCRRILKYFPPAAFLPIYALIIVVMCMVVTKCMMVAKKRIFVQL